MGFMGYGRSDGGVGVRNHVLVMSSVSCANAVVNGIARELPDIKAVTHSEGCGRGPADLAMTARTLTGLGKNPNVAAVLLVGLGCEFITSEYLMKEIGTSGKPVEAITIQGAGGSQKCMRKGIEIGRRLLAYAGSSARAEFDWANLTLGLECGGSDSMSGVTANPMVGVAADWIVSEGGTAIISETTEMIGTEKLLSQRGATDEVSKKIVDLIAKQRKLAEETLGPFADLTISPGNIEGGLSSIQEKSLGCIIKGGTSPIREILDYGDRVTKKGLAIMDTPGSDIFSVTGMVAGGAQIIVFTTGRGTPVGFPIAPVIKIASNSELFQMMSEDMDINAGRILEGESIEEAGAELIDLVKRVANGDMTKAEINRQDVVSIHTVGPAF